MALQDALIGPFTWGAGGKRLTPEEVARQREILALLAGQAETGPVGHWTQGAARMVNALGDVLDERRLDKAEAQNSETNESLLASLLGSVVGSSSVAPSSFTTPAPVAATPSSPTTEEERITSRIDQAHGDMTNWADAIASIESAGSGDYAAIGPSHPELGRALGRYQVMEANIGPWSQAALGREVTADEFLANPELQDAIFNHQFGGYVDKYGPQGAAQAWFGGEGGVGQLGRQDSLGTSIGEYTQKFTAALGGESPAMAATNARAQQPVEVAQSGGINPAIIEALTSPHADEQTRGMAQILLEQELQRNDPSKALEMEIQREKLNQLRNPPPRELINAGDGRLYNPNSGEWIMAPGGTQDAPTVQTFYGKDGSEYKAQWNRQTGEWEQVGGSRLPDGMSFRTRPDGTVELVQGAGAGQKLTEAQGKDIGFYTRGMDANAQLQELGSELTDFTQQAAGNLPMGVGNYLRDPRFRQAKVAADNFLTALLRKDTGAAITPQEFEMYGPMFLPAPGDDPNTMQQKARARQVALLAIRSGLGTAEAIGEANRIALGLSEQELPTFTPTAVGKGNRDGGQSTGAQVQPNSRATSESEEWQARQIEAARKAVESGKRPDAVRKLLNDNGINTDGLEWLN